MRTVLFLFVLGIGTLALESPLQAHPGHDHSDDISGWVDEKSSTDFKEGAGILGPLFLTLVSCFIAMMVITSVLKGKPCIRLASFGTFAMAMAIPFFDTGCDDRGGVALAGAPAQPRHKAADLQKLFEQFKKDGVTVRADKQFLYINSNGFPSHPMMVGITAWQQQVPLPQPYTGENCWKIPLQPVLAARPISAKTDLFRGAIALAVNGVPIFNALNNRGEDAYLAGELDEFGGHCGRGDDYHYHVAPTHLEKIVGKGKPIAFALDGFPLFGYTDADGREPADLDEFNGRFEKDGSYRYYSTKKYPYINGGMRGVVSVRGGQIDPQPRDSPARPAGNPLPGAKITDFSRNDATKTFTLCYDLKGKSHTVKYTVQADGVCTFVYTDGNGRETTETYRRRNGGPGPQPKKK